ncbi:hypothetical protein KIN20_004915 [Parelaphostrongylus tenuis]|uniref:Uncharacterized protein n=1 Tax=Parelaphostrongylus tenuis TaxID=148309 RepID=A0AAD5QI96_PARTN|nr:hypothetical protein KIN20_004915 [Parelaphostrongylus tenuis]
MGAVPSGNPYFSYAPPNKIRLEPNGGEELYKDERLWKSIRVIQCEEGQDTKISLEHWLENKTEHHSFASAIDWLICIEE